MRSIHYWLSVGSFSLVDSNFAWRSRRGNFQDNYSSEELNTKKSARLTLILWYLYWLKKGWRSIFREIEGTEGFCLMRDSIEPTPKERRNENREKNQWKREAFHSVWLPILIFDSPKRAVLQKNERIRKKRDEIVELSEWLAPDIHDMAGIFDSSPILTSHYRRLLYAPHFT